MPTCARRADFRRRLEAEIRRVDRADSNGFCLVRLHSEFARWIDVCFDGEAAFGRHLCRRLSEASGTDAPTARFGREEFAVLLPGVRTAGAARERGEALLGAFDRPIAYSGRTFMLHASAGVVVAGGRGRRPDSLLEAADFALSRARDQRGATVELYSSEEHREVSDAIALVGEVRRGLENDEFELHFQPLVDREDGGVAGFESLVRWAHPERGLLPAGEFVPVLERSGVIEKLDQWVVRESCRCLAAWCERASARRPFVSVNLSRRELVVPDFGERVRRIVEESDVDPTHLRFELTETSLVDEPGPVRTNLEAIRALGSQIWVDDFGVGQSSMRCLKRYPVDGIKLDRTFMGGAIEEDVDLVEALLAFGRRLDLDLVVEGVATRCQLELVRGCDCDLVQGYYLSRGVDREGAEGILEERLEIGGD